MAYQSVETPDVIYHSRELVPYKGLDEKLGEGHGGVVDKVLHKATGTVYARKTIYLPGPVKGTSDIAKIKEKDRQRKIKRAKNEAEINFKKLNNHRHIVKVIETYQTMYEHRGEAFCIILSPVAECNLEVLLTRINLETDVRERIENLDRMQHWAGCLVRATNYMHSMSVKHKDIKLNNILVDRNRIYIADFGVAKDFGDTPLNSATTRSNQDGTRGYLPPEAFADEPRGRATDMFSLGCVFLEMATVMIAPGRLDELISIRSNDSAYAKEPAKVLHWICWLNIIITNIWSDWGVDDLTTRVVNYAGMLPGFAFQMMDPIQKQRIKALELQTIIIENHSNIFCPECRIGVPRKDPDLPVHSIWNLGPDMGYPNVVPANPLQLTDVPKTWEKAKEKWLKKHMHWVY